MGTPSNLCLQFKACDPYVGSSDFGRSMTNAGSADCMKLEGHRSCIQWEFQDPKMEVLYHIRPYFVGIFSYIGLKNRPYIW